MCAVPESLLGKIPLCYFAFDLSYCDGYDIRDGPLLGTHQLLQRCFTHRAVFATQNISWNTGKNCQRGGKKWLGRDRRQAHRQP